MIFLTNSFVDDVILQMSHCLFDYLQLNVFMYGYLLFAHS